MRKITTTYPFDMLKPLFSKESNDRIGVRLGVNGETVRQWEKRGRVMSDDTAIWCADILNLPRPDCE